MCLQICQKNLLGMLHGLCLKNVFGCVTRMCPRISYFTGHQPTVLVSQSQDFSVLCILFLYSFFLSNPFIKTNSQIYCHLHYPLPFYVFSFYLLLVIWHTLTLVLLGFYFVLSCSAMEKIMAMEKIFGQNSLTLFKNLVKSIQQKFKSAKKVSAHY